MNTFAAIATYLLAAAGVALMLALATVPLVLDRDAERSDLAPAVPLRPRPAAAPTATPCAA